MKTIKNYDKRILHIFHAFFIQLFLLDSKYFTKLKARSLAIVFHINFRVNKNQFIFSTLILVCTLGITLRSADENRWDICRETFSLLKSTACRFQIPCVGCS